MIKEIPINEPHILAIEVSGKLTKEDYASFVPQLNRLIEKERRISLLIKLDDFDGWTAKAAWEDLKIAFKHDDDFVRIAIVGDGFLERLLTTAGNVFLNTEVKYFEEEFEALSWLNEVRNLSEKDEYSGYRHILIATDFSRFSDSAIKKAVEIAQPFNAKITLLHVAEYISADLYPSLGELAVPVLADNPELEKEHLEKIKEDMKEEVAKLHLANRTMTIEAISGHPADTIVDYSNHHGVDLIVMGSHGRRGLARLLGSSTNGVINHAPCDVLTVV